MSQVPRVGAKFSNINMYITANAEGCEGQEEYESEERPLLQPTHDCLLLEQEAPSGTVQPPPGLRVQTEPRLAGVREVGGEGAAPVVTEGTPGALDAVGCESVWVKRVHSLGYLRGLWCDKWTNVVAVATMGFASGPF